MKAVILAGGTGTRLRPLSITRPKPMVKLLDKPLLEHIIVLLRDNGFDEICLTLQYLPNMIKDYFGDGSDFGVFLEYRTEDKPLGTAGSVKACSDFIGGEDFIIVSGDAACKIDLNSFFRYHQSKAADASILLKQCLDPLEYGLVITDTNGRITSFIEKPSEDRVYSDLVNTGIYVIGKSVLEKIPENIAVDFGAELFPKMLAENMKLYGFVGEGYWNDVGSCSAYLKTNFDYLDPKTKVFISSQATVRHGAKIGPNAVIGTGSRVGADCEIKNSVIDGAVIGSGCSITGSIVCSGANVGDRSVISEGCVIADGVVIGSDSYISEAVRIWPGKKVEPGSRVMRNITDGKGSFAPSFSVKATITGEAVSEITPELAQLMGMSKAKLTRCGAACSKSQSGNANYASLRGNYASIIADSFLSGCQASGKEAYLLDSLTAATAAFAGKTCGLDLTLFVYQNGKDMTLSFFDRNGLPIPRKIQRDIESACYNEAVRAMVEDCPEQKNISGTFEMHLAAAMSEAGVITGLGGFTVAAKGRMLMEAFKAVQAKIMPPSDGVLELELSSDGFSLTATDETGRKWNHGRLLCALVYTELAGGVNNSERYLTIPYDAPQIADTLAAILGGTLYRLGRDGAKAVEVWFEKPCASDGLFIALKLCGWLKKNNAKLSELMSMLPEFHTAESEYSVNTSSARLLRSLTRAYQSELVSGLSVRSERGSARIMSQGNRLKISAESYSMEAAWELCSEIRKKAADIDKG